MYFWRDAIFVVKFRHARHRSPIIVLFGVAIVCWRLQRRYSDDARIQNVAKRQRQTKDARHLVELWQQRDAQASAQRSASCQLAMRLLTISR